MAARATIADVARRAGVSRTTVSHALSGKGRVDPETRARVKAAARDLGYRPSVRAQRLRVGRSGAVAIMSALPPTIVGENSEMGFLLEMAMPAARECLAHGCSLVLVPPGATREHLDGLDVDGAIVIDPRDRDPNCAALAERGVTVVTVGRAVGVDAVAVIDRGLSGADAMLDHLVEQGARRIGVLLSVEAHSVSVLLQRELAANGGVWRGAEVTVWSAEAAVGEESGYALATRMLTERPDLDAVYAPLDAFAVGVMRAASAAGWRVPEDLMVATNYDGPRAASVVPHLTALDLDLGRIAAQAAGLLMRALNGEAVASERAPEPVVVAYGSTAIASTVSHMRHAGLQGPPAGPKLAGTCSRVGDDT